MSLFSTHTPALASYGNGGIARRHDWHNTDMTLTSHTGRSRGASELSPLKDWHQKQEAGKPEALTRLATPWQLTRRKQRHDKTGKTCNMVGLHKDLTQTDRPSTGRIWKRQIWLPTAQSAELSHNASAGFVRRKLLRLGEAIWKAEQYSTYIH